MRFPRLTGAYVGREEFNAILDQIEQELAAARNITVGAGLECRQLAGGNAISLAHTSNVPGGGVPSAAEDFWAKITGATLVSTNQWEYTFIEVEKGAIGLNPGGWSDKTLEGTAYNSIEYMNFSAGVQGNGVDIDGADFPATMGLQPCPETNIVWMHRLENGAGETEYWFSYENGVDGTCS